MSYRVRRLLSPLARLAAPAYSHCLRCKMPWAFVREHITKYEDGAGCFPLCQGCWSELDLFSRLMFYAQLWQEWKRGGDLDEMNQPTRNALWTKIQGAVIRGG